VGSIVATVAEAGVGKSRLFDEFKARNQSGWMVLEALSFSHDKASAYLPVLDVLQSYFEIEAAAGAKPSSPNSTKRARELAVQATIQGARRASGQTIERAASTKRETDLCAGSAVLLYDQVHASECASRITTFGSLFPLAGFRGPGQDEVRAA
jgi:hypothetical protein